MAVHGRPLSALRWSVSSKTRRTEGCRRRGARSLATPELEVMHAGGVSTGRSRRTYLMHSQSIYRYYGKHRAEGWQRATLPMAWVALRARAELVALRDRRRL
jgi:GT2 family glycosyltransferase